MMSVLKVFMAVVLLLILPFGLGLPFQGKVKHREKRFFYTLLCGYAAMLAWFQLLSVPMVLLGCSYRSLVWACGVSTFAAAGFFFFRFRGDVQRLTVGRLRTVGKFNGMICLACLLILVQLAWYVFGVVTDLDDAFYVGAATTAQYTNQMYRVSSYTGKVLKQLPSRYCLSPFPMFLAYVSSVSGIPAAVMAHTVEPVFFLSLSYGVCGLLGERLFQKDRTKNGMFLTLLSLTNIYSYYSIYNQGTFTLLRIWQGKAFLAAVLLPALFYAVLRVLDVRAQRADWALLLCLLIASCAVSSMGIMLAPIMTGVLGIVGGIVTGISGRKLKKLLAMALCCLPSLCYAVTYVMIR